MVRTTDRQATPTRRTSLHQRTGISHQELHQAPQQRPKTIRLAQNRRSDPRFSRTILYANFRLRTLGEFVLMYEDVRKAVSPSAAILDFCHSTYEAGAT